MLKAENEKMKKEIARWEHCHRQDMADNLRLRNQIAMLMGWDPVQPAQEQEMLK